MSEISITCREDNIARYQFAVILRVAEQQSSGELGLVLVMLSEDIRLHFFGCRVLSRTRIPSFDLVATSEINAMATSCTRVTKY